VIVWNRFQNLHGAALRQESSGCKEGLSGAAKTKNTLLKEQTMNLSQKEEKLLRRVDKRFWYGKFGFVCQACGLIIITGAFVFIAQMAQSTFSRNNIRLPNGVFLAFEEIQRSDTLDILVAHQERVLAVWLLAMAAILGLFILSMSLHLIWSLAFHRRERLIRTLSARLRELGEIKPAQEKPARQATESQEAPAGAR